VLVGEAQLVLERGDGVGEVLAGRDDREVDRPAHQVARATLKWKKTSGEDDAGAAVDPAHGLDAAEER
jgi:hypothetical protein